MTTKWRRPAVAGAIKPAFRSEQLRRRLDHSPSPTTRPAQAECRECGRPLVNKQAQFCGPGCRADFHNRRAKRGAEIFDLAMAWRFDRRRAKKEKALSAMCRMLGQFRGEDWRDRAGRPSWDSVQRIKERNLRLVVTVLAPPTARRRDA
jgi:hypothetical protein